MRYNVRCCCQPKKILGTLELQDGLRDGDRLPVMIIDSSSIEYIQLRRFVQWHRTDINQVAVPNFDNMPPMEEIDEIAIYSDDRPIEFWRRVHGFQETH